jgi:DNA-binding transcriptional ArsR family regulator
MKDALSATFAALADPTRRSILTQLTKGQATVTELAAPHAMSLPSVSRHLKVLEKAGLVTKGRSAQWRLCRLEVEELQAADEWMAPYRKFFENRFDRLEEQLEQMVAAKEPSSPGPAVRRTIEETKKKPARGTAGSRRRQGERKTTKEGTT